MRCLLLSALLAALAAPVPPVSAATVERSDEAAASLGAINLSANDASARLAGHVERTGELSGVDRAAQTILTTARQDPIALALRALTAAVEGKSPRDAADHPVWGAVARAAQARMKGDLTAARREIAAALRAAPDNAYALNLAGLIAAASGDPEEAEARISAAAEARPASVYLANLGAMRLMRGDAPAALNVYDRAVAAPFAGCVAHLGRSSALRALGRVEDSGVDLEACLALEPKNPAALRARVEAALLTGEADAAARHLEAARPALAPEEARRLDLGLALAQGEGERVGALYRADKDDPLVGVYAAALTEDLARAHALAAGLPGDDAEAEMTRIAMALAARRAPPDASGGAALTPQLALMRGLAAAARGEDAGDLLAQAAGALPGFLGAGLEGALAAESIPDLALGAFWAMRDMPQPAAAALEKAEAAHASPLTAYLRGLALKRLDPAQAEAALERARRAAPQADGPNAELAEIALARGDLTGARDLYRAALGHESSFGMTLRTGMISERLGDEEAARADYARLTRIAPDSFVGYNQLAWRFAEVGDDLPRALELARKADALQPGNAAILDTIGWTLFQLGDLGGAREALEQALLIGGPQSEIISLHLAKVATAQGEPARARALLTLLAVGSGAQAQEAKALLDELPPG